MNKNDNVNNVLVVDDEPDTLEAIKLILEKEGLKPLLANNGKKALEIINKDNINLVILDIMMPDMDGWEVFKKIRDLNSSIPIAFLTAIRTQNIYLLLGMYYLNADDYIIKPFDRVDFIKRVKKLLNMER